MKVGLGFMTSENGYTRGKTAVSNWNTTIGWSSDGACNTRDYFKGMFS
jgi:hypothetical protein